MQGIAPSKAFRTFEFRNCASEMEARQAMNDGGEKESESVLDTEARSE